VGLFALVFMAGAIFLQKIFETDLKNDLSHWV
jgi:hypothetical protein